VTARDIRTEAIDLIEQMPEESTWDDVLYAIFVRQAIERGLEASAQGRTKTIDEVKRRLGITG
jgi:hypothetical protein